MEKNFMESHYTATGLVVNPGRDKVLVIYHKKLQLWLPAGGHVEVGEMPHEAVVREVFEETGIKARVINASQELALSSIESEYQIPAPLFVLHEHIPAYKDKDEHMHYDFIYAMETELDTCCANEHEVEAVKWVTKEQLHALKTTEATAKMYSMLLDAC